MSGAGSGTGAWLFAVFNIIVFAAVFFLLLRQPADELRLGIASVRLQESRLAIKERNLAAMDENKESLAAWEDTRYESEFFPYDALAGALANISHAARRYNLTERVFAAGEPVTRGTVEYGSGKTAAAITASEITVEVSCEGPYEDLCRYIETLAGGNGYFIRRLVLEKAPDEPGLSAVRITLALYGIGGGDE